MTPKDRLSHVVRFGRAIGAPLGIAAGVAALVATAGCGSRDGSGLSAQGLAAAGAQPAGAPVLVTCEPHPRTLVRPVVVNGATLSQVECVTNGLPVSAQPVSAQSFAPAAPQYRPARPVYDDLGDARVVSAPPPAARPVRTRQVVYDEPVRNTRSVKKSAIIIGSSAGVGAGVGAAVGGKKGALIGAAIGGGSAAIWDQVTRRDR
jgi:hypothetical protein